MEPHELVAIMAAIIYAGKRSSDRPGPEMETKHAAVEEAWQIWHLTQEESIGAPALSSRGR